MANRVWVGSAQRLRRLLRSKRPASMTRECQRAVCGQPPTSGPEWFEMHRGDYRQIEGDPNAYDRKKHTHYRHPVLPTRGGSPGSVVNDREISEYIGSKLAYWRFSCHMSAPLWPPRKTPTAPTNTFIGGGSISIWGRWRRRHWRLMPEMTGLSSFIDRKGLIMAGLL